MNIFELYPDRLIVVVTYRDEPQPQIAPMPDLSVESLLRASQLAKVYSESFGVTRAAVWNTAEEIPVTVFADGVVQPAPEPNPYVGML